MKTVSGLVAILALASLAPLSSQADKGRSIRLADYPIRTFSVVVHDTEQSARAWADLLGVEEPKIQSYRGLMYREGHEGDREAYPKMAVLRFANMEVSMHQPMGGRSYWRDLLDQHGEMLYRVNVSVPDMAGHVAFLEGKGGKLVLGDPPRSPYSNVSLWPKFGFAVETNMLRPEAAIPAPPPTTAFASNNVFKIGFVVSDIEKAARKFADLFGVEVPQVVPMGEPIVFPPDFTGDRSTKVKIAVLRLPGNVVVQLNEPQGGPSPWRDHLQKHGRSMFNIGIRVKDVNEQVAYLTRKGGKLILGGQGARYAYFDFTSRLGAILEVHE